jgi:aminoglycoside/choline kinase family phosphotransferase
MIALAIPDGPEAMTPAWLTTALRVSGVLTDAVVTAVTWQPLSAQGWTTQMARLAVTYDAPVAGLPATLVTKSAAQDASTRVFFGRFYAREVAFYQRVAPEVPLRVPRCYYAAYEAATHAHVLLLEDLAPVLADDLLHGVSADVAAAYTRAIAALHAHWWEHARLLDLMRYFPAHGGRFAADYAASLTCGLAVMRPWLMPTTATLAMALQRHLQARWDDQQAAPRTLIHWDAQAANFLRPARAGAREVVVDWQNCVVGRGIWDVARFCVMSLPPGTRRAAQADLVALYAETLGAHGVQGYSFAQCFTHYQAVFPLLFAQQLRFFAGVQGWDAARRAWVEAITPRVVAALHEAAEAKQVG